MKINNLDMRTLLILAFVNIVILSYGQNQLNIKFIKLNDCKDFSAQLHTKFGDSKIQKVSDSSFVLAFNANDLEKHVEEFVYFYFNNKCTNYSYPFYLEKSTIKNQNDLEIYFGKSGSKWKAVVSDGYATWIYKIKKMEGELDWSKVDKYVYNKE